jgi:hypothetical protein
MEIHWFPPHFFSNPDGDRMKSFALTFAGFALATSVACAQGADPDKLNTGGGVTAAGWKGRIDPQAAKGGRSINQDKFVSMGSGFHATGGPAAIYWNPANTMSGNYTVTGTFTQTKAPTHPEAYGLILAGKDLETPNQGYLYFLVRGDGKYLINHRANDSTVHKIVDWTANDAVKAADANGKATNKLSVVVGADKVTFLVNGTEVASRPRAVFAGPDGSGTTGIAGLRINHNLDVHIDGFSATPNK